VREDLPDDAGIVDGGDQAQTAPTVVSEPMLTIHNHQAAASGIPPAFSNEAADLDIGYFENRHGEPWTFTFNRATRARRGSGAWTSAGPARTLCVTDGSTD
jgi:hypothetical protein